MIRVTSKLKEVRHYIFQYFSFLIYLITFLKNFTGTCAIRRCVFFDVKSASGGGGGGGGDEPTDECKDTEKYKEQCPDWANKHNLCKTAEYKNFMSKNCKESCGLCPKKEQTACNMVEIFGKLNGKQKLKLISKGE